MTSLFLNPFVPTNVESNVDTSAKDANIPNVEASEKVAVETQTLESEKPKSAVLG
ncbi:hypothetical protein A2U01_0088490, partial [Trifolium medium]|nr:hypothetical protein [Trifolium medium]